MGEAEGRCPLSSGPFAAHTVVPSGYVERAEDAERRAAHGEVQSRCPACGLWAVWRPGPKYGRVLLVGEDNPHGSDPRFALYDEPPNSAGGRLRRVVLGLPRRVYLGQSIGRANLCTGRWSVREARARAATLANEAAIMDAAIVMLGWKVADAFGALHVQPFTRVERFVAIPHPSGRNRVWNDQDAVPRVRALLAAVAPAIPWGSGV